MSVTREVRRIDGASLTANPRTGVVVSGSKDEIRVGFLVAQFVAVLLRRYPEPASYSKLLRELYPSKNRPVDGPSAIRTHAKRARKALRPLGFEVVTVRPVHADCPSAYRIARLSPPGTSS